VGTLIWSPEVEVSAACKMITTHHRKSNEDVNNKKALGFKLTIADDGQISCNNSWKKLRISNISTNMCIWGCAHYYTSAMYLA
jgi:hypothetical protein